MSLYFDYGLAFTKNLSLKLQIRANTQMHCFIQPAGVALDITTSFHPCWVLFSFCLKKAV